MAHLVCAAGHRRVTIHNAIAILTSAITEGSCGHRLGFLHPTEVTDVKGPRRGSFDSRRSPRGSGSGLSGSWIS